MHAIRIQGPGGRQDVTKISEHGEVFTGYNTKVFKTERGAQNAVDRIALGYNRSSFVVFPCDSVGREIKPG